MYLVSADLVSGERRDEVDLVQLLNVAWRYKWWVALMTSACIVIAVAYALAATEWYRAEIKLAPADERSANGMFAQIGGLASLAGISVGGGGTAEPIAILKSREFARSFIEAYELVPVLLHEDWDPDAKTWKERDPEKWPDVRDAIRYFDEKVREVSEDAKTGMVVLGVKWTDPEIAVEWATLLVERLNKSMRDRALAEAENNVQYLRDELAATNVLTLQQSISRLLESELQKVMLARGNEEFAFRVIDPAMTPKERFKPRRTLIVALAAVLGLMMSTVLVIALALLRIRAK
ncbi:MAG: Wzz/FepE/Etk N-terminal domain-containing protein [Desulfobacterales bacterium]